MIDNEHRICEERRKLLKAERDEARACLKEAIVHINMWMPEGNLPHPEQLRKWVRVANRKDGES